MWPFRKYQLGKLKNLSKMTIDDFKKHNVWVCDLTGEGRRGHDETSVRPILEDVDITPRMARKFVSVELLIRATEGDLWGAAVYLNNSTLRSVGFWLDNRWQTPLEAGLGEATTLIEAIPSIGGIRLARFSYDPKNCRATRA